jgi:transcriptional regulator with XRE-family HTH domain
LPPDGGSQGSLTIRRWRLGIELRQLREAAGLAVDEVAAELYCSRSKISRIEVGRVGVTPRDIRDMLQLYSASNEQRESIQQLAHEARQKRDLWWRAYGELSDMVKTFIDLETAAESIRMYEAVLVPGLLQTEDYARSVISVLHRDLSREVVNRQVDLRMARQAALTRASPLSLYVVLDEAALHRVVGNSQVMRKQLKWLVDATEMSNVRLQIIPFKVGEHPGMVSPFQLLRFPDLSYPEVVFIENPIGDLYLDSSEQTRQYSALFSELETFASRAEKTIDILVERIRRL